MDDPKAIYQGYCVKSPPNPSHRWHRRWFTLTLEEIKDLPLFLKTYYKDYKKGLYNSLIPDKTTRLVLTYYKDETCKKLIGKFIIDDSLITDCPFGINDYKYAIKIKLSGLYNDRTLHLCFKEDQKENYTSWLSSLKEQYDVIHRHDSVTLTSNIDVKFYQPCDNTPMHKELQKIRSQMTEERLEKERQSQCFDDVEIVGNDLDVEENTDFDVDDEPYPDDSELYTNIEILRSSYNEEEDLYANVDKPSTKF